MKYLIMTEGSCEKAVLDVFIEKGILKYKKEDLLYEEIHRSRQIKGDLIAKIEQLPPNEKVTVIRLGDNLSDELKIPKSLKNKIIKGEKVCIKPEFEILHIIRECKYKTYNKNKHMKPSEYLVNQVLLDYQKTYAYNYDYFLKMNVEEVRSLIKEYNVLRHETHQRDEYTLDYLIDKI